jgi:hypothetical protein
MLVDRPGHEDYTRRPLGCFAVVKMVNKCHVVSGPFGTVFHGASAPYVRHVLDGGGGEPLFPGQWLIDAFKSTDRCVFGPARDKHADDIAEAKKRAAQRKRDDFARGRSRDEMMFKSFAKIREELGVTVDKGEMISMEKEAESLGALQEQRDLVDRKEARYVPPDRSDEEML